MQNAYYKLVTVPGGFGVHFFAPKDGGEKIVTQELINYLDNQQISYDLSAVKVAAESGEDQILKLGDGECPRVAETYIFTLSPDNMLAVAKFTPASDTGDRLTIDEFLKDMAFRQIRSGIQEEILKKHFEGPGYYGVQVPVARGKKPRHGTDAKIEYYFNTKISAHPEMAEDGTVDYFHLNMINHCKVGDVLARIIPEDKGDPGMTVQGSVIKPRDVRTCRLHFGNNIELSEDRLSIRSKVNGHVMLYGDQVFVSNVYEVENVDNSTGNIDYDGSVKINGNVATNFEVKATGDIIVNGVVEGAILEAGGNITIARGMKGMSKGVLKAGGNVISKFIENSTIEAGGFIDTESILHSNVQSGSDVRVTGKKGFITGGRVQAESMVEVRTLGATMGASTVVEVGVNPQLKAQYIRTQKEVAEIVKVIKNTQPVIQNFTEKKAKGARFTPEQLEYVKKSVALIDEKKKELEEKSAILKELDEVFAQNKKASVRVTGEVYPGTTIVIGDVSMNVQDSYRYCRFEKVNGDVKMMPL